MKRLALVVLLLPLLGGCDRLKERMGMSDPAKREEEGKAIGGGCRNAGRGLEDCYTLNSDAKKSAIYAGWKEMNEYMLKNNMQALPPVIPPESDVEDLPRKTAPPPVPTQPAERPPERPAERAAERPVEKAVAKPAAKPAEATQSRPAREQKK
jgi:hypothetical protein